MFKPLTFLLIQHLDNILFLILPGMYRVGGGAAFHIFNGYSPEAAIIWTELLVHLQDSYRAEKLIHQHIAMLYIEQGNFKETYLEHEKIYYFIIYDVGFRMTQERETK